MYYLILFQDIIKVLHLKVFSLMITPFGLPLWRSGKSLRCNAHGLSGRQVLEVQSSTPGPGGLSVHAGELSAYSEFISEY